MTLKTSDAAAYTYIDRQSTLNDLTRKTAKARQVAVDTEADSLHHYFEKVCLIQLTISGTNYIIDPLADINLSDFLKTLSKKPLILHGADYDLRMLQNSFGFYPENRIFDTMIAARLLGYDRLSLAALVDHFFGISLAKHGQKSNWSKRPLTGAQLDYASSDTHYLESIADSLNAELKHKNRHRWLEETVAAMVKSTASNRVRDPDDAWRIKGAGLLERRQLIFLKELWQWREKIAARKDIPTFKIMANSQMLELAAWAADHLSSLVEDFPGLPASYSDSRVQALQKALTRAAATDKKDWPGFRKREKAVHHKPGYRKLVKALKEECILLAEELGLNSSDIANNAALEEIALRQPRSLKEVMACENILPWQAKLLYPAIQKIIR